MIKMMRFAYLLICLIACSMGVAQKRYWVGNGSNTSWNTASNWSATSGGTGGASVPASSDTAVFDGNGTGQCVIDAVASVYSIEMNVGFTDTLTQSVYTLTAGPGGFIQSGGVFKGSTDAITLNGPLTISGGAFISTAGTLTFNSTFTLTGGAFAHNGGKCHFRETATLPRAITFYDFELNPSGTETLTVDSVFTVLHDFRIAGSSGTVTINNGVADLHGDVEYSAPNLNPGTTQFRITGSQKQVISSNSNLLPAILIDKPSDTLQVQTNLRMGKGLEYISGVIDDSTYSPVICFSRTQQLAGKPAFRRVLMGDTPTGTYVITINSGDTLTVLDSLLYSAGSNRISLSGVVNLKGHLESYNTYGSHAGQNQGLICFTGSDTQHVTASGTGRLPGLEFNNTGAGVFIQNNIIVSPHWKHVSGIVDVTTASSDITIMSGGTFSRIEGKTTFGNLSIGLSSGQDDFEFTDSIEVMGLFHVFGNGSPNITDGVINAHGDISISVTGALHGNGEIRVCGTNGQVFTGPLVAGQGRVCNFKVEKPSDTLWLKESFHVGNSLNIVSGMVDAVTYSPTLYFDNNFWNPKLFGNLTVAFAVFNWNSTSPTSIINIYDTLTVTEAFYWAGNQKPVMSTTTGLVDLKGDFLNSNTSTTANTGSLDIKISGNGRQQWTGSRTTDAGRIGRMIIDKPSDTLIVSGYVPMQDQPLYVTGVVDATGSESTFQVYDSGTLVSRTTWSGIDFYNLQLRDNTTTLGSDLVVEGDLTIDAGATLNASNYVVDVYEDFTQAGTFNKGTSTFRLGGDQAQAVAQSSGTMSFYNLTLQKSGGATVTLGSPVEVIGTLALDSGFVVSTSLSMLTLPDNSTVSGASNNSFVRGPVAKIGDDLFVFPTGGNNGYRPFGMSAPAGQETVIVAYKDSLTPFAMSVDSTLDYVGPCEYWEYTPGTTDLFVTLGWESALCSYADTAGLVVAVFDGTSWTDENASLRTGTQTSGSVKSLAAIAGISLAKPIRVATGIRASVFPSHATLKRSLDGGHYLVKGNKLEFKFDGEYTDGVLSYSIMDYTRSPVSPSISTNLRTYGDNRYILNFSGSGLAQGVYYLEVTNEKAEKYYLKFRL